MPMQVATLKQNFGALLALDPATSIATIFAEEEADARPVGVPRLSELSAKVRAFDCHSLLPYSM